MTDTTELADLPQQLSRCVLSGSGIRKCGRDYVPLLGRQGLSDHSYAIHVAELARLPGSVLRRARKILTLLERDSSRPGHAQPVSSTQKVQLSLFSLLDDPLTDHLSRLDVDQMRPMEALHTLADLSAMAKTMNRYAYFLGVIVMLGNALDAAAQWETIAGTLRYPGAASNKVLFQPPPRCCGVRAT